MEVHGQLYPPPQGKTPCYALDRSLGRLQRRSGRGGEEKNSQLLLKFEPPIIQQVAQHYTSELSWLPLSVLVNENCCEDLNSF
jgi:hypothetical protein